MSKSTAIDFVVMATTGLICGAIAVALTFAAPPSFGQQPCGSGTSFLMTEDERTGKALLRAATKKERRDFAAYLLKSLRPLDQAVPSLTPEENEWLKKESGAGGHRGFLAENSVIAAKWSVRLTLDGRVMILNNIKQAPSLKKEIAWWVTLAADFDDWEFARQVVQLGKHGVIAADLAPFDDGVWQPDYVLNINCGKISRDILMFIVGPYLFDRLKE